MRKKATKKADDLSSASYFYDSKILNAVSTES